MANVLVVDDEIGIRELLSEILADEGYTVRVAGSAESAREARRAQRPDLVLLDIWMPDTDGITLLKEWQVNGQLTMPVVIMSGHASIDSAVEAIRIGALDFLEKPIALQKLLATVKRALARSYVVCIRTQVSAPPPKARSTRMAISGEIPRRMWTRSLRVWRVTPRSLAAAVTVRPKGSRQSCLIESPGCGGFLIAIAFSSLVIVDQVDVTGVTGLEAKDDAPIARH